MADYIVNVKLPDGSIVQDTYSLREGLSEVEVRNIVQKMEVVDEANRAEGQRGSWDQFMRQVNKGIVPVLDAAQFAIQAGVVGMSPAAAQEQVAEKVGLGRAPEGEGRKFLGFETPFTREGTVGEFFEDVTAPEHVIPQGYAGSAGKIVRETIPAALAIYGGTAKVAVDVGTGVVRATAPGVFRPGAVPGHLESLAYKGVPASSPTVAGGRTLGQMVRDAPAQLHHFGQPLARQIGETSLKTPMTAAIADASLAGLSGLVGEYSAQNYGENSRVAGQVAGAMSPLAAMAAVRLGGHSLAWAATNSPGGVGAVTRGATALRPGKAGVRAEKIVQERMEFPDTPQPGELFRPVAVQRLGMGVAPAPEITAVRGGKFIAEAPLFATAKTGDPGLNALARSIIKEHPKLIGAEKINAQAVNAAIRDNWRSMYPSAGKVTDKDVAEVSSSYLADQLDLVIQMKKRVAEQTIDAMTPKGSLEQYARVANNKVREIEEVIGAQITELFEPIPVGVKKSIGPLRQNVVNYYENLASTFQAQIPSEIRDRFIPNVKGVIKNPFPGMGPKGGGRVSIKELQAYRSDLLEVASVAADQGKLRQARITSDVAEMVLETMEATRGAARGRVGRQLEKAIAFTREASRRTKVGQTAKILAKESRRGGTKIAPIMTLETAFGGGGIKAGVNYDDMMNTVSFQLRLIGDRFTPQQADENRRAFLDGADAYLKQNFMEMAVDPKTGRATDAGVRRFQKQYGPLLSRRPELQKDLEAAVKAEKALLEVENPSTSALRIFMPITKDGPMVQTPEKAIEDLITSPNRDIPGRALAQFKRMWVDYFHFNSRAKFIANRPEAEMGIVFSGEHIHNTLKMSDIRNLMRTPMRDGTPLFSQGDFRRLTKIANTARAIERQFAARNLAEIAPYVAKRYEIAAGIFGSQMGRTIAAALGGGTVQTPGIVAGAFRNALRSVAGVLDPTKEILLAAVFDEDILRAILTKDSASFMKKQEARTIINAWMYGVLMEHGHSVNLLSSTEQEE